MRKVIHIFILILLINCFYIKVQAAENLIKNGGFEKVSYNMPENWYKDIWDISEGSSRIYIDTAKARTGQSCAVIENFRDNDSKLVQKVPVKPDTVYKLSCWIKAEQCGKNGRGGNIGVLYIFDTSENYKDTAGQWKLVEVYGRTGKEQYSLEVTARLGGYSSINKGKVYFDDFAVEEVKQLPAGERVINFFREDSAYKDGQIVTDKRLDSSSFKIVSAGKLGGNSLLFIFLFLSALYILKNRERFNKELKLSQEKGLLMALLAVGLLLRLMLAPLTEGHTTDIYCFKYWAKHAAEKGLSGFYTTDMFVDYPPGYIYVLYFLGKLQGLLQIDLESRAFLAVLKLPAILADIACTYVLYRFSRKKSSGSLGLVLGALYLLNPAVVVNSAVWGQIDGIFTLFIVLVIFFAAEEKMRLSAVIFTLAVLVKPQALIFTPVLLFVLIRKRDFKELLYSLLFSIIAAVAVIFPFTLKQSPLWIVEKYMSTLASYPYGSVNAFNLYTLFGGNWMPDTTRLLAVTYKTWTLIFILSIVVFSALIFFRSREKSRIFYIAFFIISAVFVLSSKMHERYLFPSLALGLLWYIYSQDKRALQIFSGFTLTHYLNVDYVLQLNGRNINHVQRNDVLLILVSAANVFLIIWLIKTGIELYLLNREAKMELNWLPLSGLFRKNGSNRRKNIKKLLLTSQPLRNEEEVKYGKKDYLLLSILIVLYSAVALYKLGSFNTPQSLWKPESKGEYVTADLGKVLELEKIYYYGAALDSGYTVYLSKDKSQWVNAGNIKVKSIYQWGNLPVNAKARYIKISADEAGSAIGEIGIFEKGSRSPAVIKVSEDSSEGSSGSAAFDEQNTVSWKPSFMGEMIFDEIYHARTAYEHIHGISPYEWTHPPLGKLIIAVGILIFGMNPFGWRIAGTLFGIAMIPFMYYFGKRLFKRPEYAFLTAFLMTFDFMHFVQTRIATVDVYAVFFTIGMYYFMYRYINTDYYSGKYKKSLLMLALSGIFFGLGASAKWSCIYGGVGLAVIFFKDLYDRYGEYALAGELLKEGSSIKKGGEYYCREIRESFKGKTFITLSWCMFFFIIVPLVLYIVSYIPYMSIQPKGQGIEAVINLQKAMYTYHSTLVAEHPFSSSWWEWPFIIRPIWYYSGQAYLPSDKISSIVSMGNPAVWWPGAAACIAMIILGIRKGDRMVFFIFTAGASQYLPWMLVPRLTFIYHYFAFVPFMILALVYVIEYLKERESSLRYAVYGHMLAAALLFLLFYPVLSGMVIDKGYAARFLRWFSSWVFFS